MSSTEEAYSKNNCNCDYSNDSDGADLGFSAASYSECGPLSASVRLINSVVMCSFTQCGLLGHQFSLCCPCFSTTHMALSRSGTTSERKSRRARRDLA